MWFTALIIGFAGSMHCLGMCSPLVMAVSQMSPTAVINRVLYNTGRIATYGLMGALVSGIGFALPLSRFQNLFSILLGITLLVIGFGGAQKIHIPGITRRLQKLTNSLKNLFGHFLKQKTKASLFILGALNGLLPCGLTFIALTYCLTLQGPLDGFNFMLLFGAGTLPVMLGFTGIIQHTINKFNWHIHKVTTTMLILSGILLIVRVLVIHIPHATSFNDGVMDIVLCR